MDLHEEASSGSLASGAHLNAADEPHAVSLLGLFHRVNRLIPDAQEILSVSPDTPATEALARMREQGYSQLPVVEGRAVLGFFSYRSVALSALSSGLSLGKLEEAVVGDFLEHPSYVTIYTDLNRLVEILCREDAVVVGGEDLLQGVLTPMDVVRYLVEVADAFVLLGEIELALRALIHQAVSEGDLQHCIRNSLGHYAEETRPQRLQEFTFDDYISILRDGRNWKLFEPVFGGTRESLRMRLEPIRDIRNNVFHFRRPDIGVTVEEHERLVAVRQWLLTRVRILEARRRGCHEV